VGPLDIVTPRRTNYTFYYINIPCVRYNEVRNNLKIASQMDTRAFMHFVFAVLEAKKIKIKSNYFRVRLKVDQRAGQLNSLSQKMEDNRRM